MQGSATRSVIYYKNIYLCAITVLQTLRYLTWVPRLRFFLVRLGDGNLRGNAVPLEHTQTDESIEIFAEEADFRSPTDSRKSSKSRRRTVMVRRSPLELRKARHQAFKEDAQ